LRELRLHRFRILDRSSLFSATDTLGEAREAAKSVSICRRVHDLPR
jgi:hypothetical protein